jgi:hypothetical protein
MPFATAEKAAERTATDLDAQHWIPGIFLGFKQGMLGPASEIRLGLRKSGGNFSSMLARKDAQVQCFVSRITKAAKINVHACLEMSLHQTSFTSRSSTQTVSSSHRKIIPSLPLLV